jgi:lipopolysaccharide export LptBFGC system permease protein LptF
MLFLAIGKKGSLDPWIAGWLPNAVFFCLGVTWVWRMR